MSQFIIDPDAKKKLFSRKRRLKSHDIIKINILKFQLASRKNYINQKLILP